MTYLLIFIIIVLLLYIAIKNYGSHKPENIYPIENENFQKDSGSKRDIGYEELVYFASKKIRSEFYRPQTELADTSNYFYGKKIVITGDYMDFPDRNKLARMFWEVGADIDSSVGAHTQILIVGYNAGPSKLEKAKAQGIEIIDQSEIDNYFENYKDFL